MNARNCVSAGPVLSLALARQSLECCTTGSHSLRAALQRSVCALEMRPEQLSKMGQSSPSPLRDARGATHPAALLHHPEGQHSPVCVGVLGGEKQAATHPSSYSAEVLGAL